MARGADVWPVGLTFALQARTVRAVEDRHRKSQPAGLRGAYARD